MAQSGATAQEKSEQRRPMARVVLRLAGSLALFADLAVHPTGAVAQEPVAAHVPARARIAGIVFDSLSQRPLAGAVVQLVLAGEPNRARSMETNAGGVFSFDSVGAGSYMLGFYHPLLDSLLLQTPLSRVDVRTGGTVRASLAIPSAGALRTALCGPRALPDSIGALIAFVRSATTGAARPRSRMQVQWSEFEIRVDGLYRTTPSVQGESNAQGGVVICGIPRDNTVTLHAWNASDSSGYADVMVPPSGILRRDVFVGTSRAVAIRDVSSGSSGITTTVLRGSGVLRGIVRRPDGTPIAGARLSFWGSGVEATTTSAGAYLMRELPTGTYTLEARAVGFVPQRHAIDVMEGVETVAEVRLESLGTYLDTVKVTAKRVHATAPDRTMREFEERRKRGFGTFLDEKDIGKRNPLYLADLVRAAPGVVVLPRQFGYQIVMRGGRALGTPAPDRSLDRPAPTTGYCNPYVYLDGKPVVNDNGDIDRFVNLQDIRAIEVYPHGASTPAAFQSLTGCGSLLIWTGARRTTNEATQPMPILR